ncbi:MAG TPA: Gfo/Idh/MocA family oxidoreductase [Lacisediminihabitans sp.]|uniref:Gfo/Idh/MocA family protein n=1 Tax=Lacisediminihabitans sp. TaxID=2787631 RepID=UPI002EDB75A9
MRIGVIGVGNISAQYFAHIPGLPNLELVAVADVNEERAREVAGQQGVRALTVDELLADAAVDAVLNLTIPAAHAAIGIRALEAGKHVYGEKPLALNPAEAEPLLTLAAEKGLRVGSAPDTVLGTGIQTARKALDDGAVGQPIAAAIHWSAPGHELWHPAPAFYYQPGGGPLLDMGPYYLTSIVTLFGPIARVSGTATTSSRNRVVATGPLAGTPIPVNVATHVSALLEHQNGLTTTMTVSFDVWKSRAPLFEVFGTEGTMAVPDPNQFDGDVEIAPASTREWETIPVSAGWAGAGRGYGLSDMARAIETGRPHRASGELAFHVLEVMDGILRAARERTVVEIASTAERPAPVPLDSTPATW